MFPRRIVSATLLDNSTPRAGTAYDAVILRGDSDASSGYVLRVGQEVVVSSEDPDDPFLARVGKLIYTPSEKPPWSFTCRWYYKIKEVAADAVKKNLSKVRLATERGNENGVRRDYHGCSLGQSTLCCVVPAASAERSVYIEVCTESLGRPVVRGCWWLA